MATTPARDGARTTPRAPAVTILARGGCRFEHGLWRTEGSQQLACRLAPDLRGLQQPQPGRELVRVPVEANGHRADEPKRGAAQQRRQQVEQVAGARLGPPLSKDIIGIWLGFRKACGRYGVKSVDRRLCSSPAAR